MASPYDNLDVSKWQTKTQELLDEHPLKLAVIREVALETWDVLWRTKIGDEETAIRLDEIDVPATVVGYFFEKLFARALEKRFPGQWRGTKSKDEKDIVYLPDLRYSTEMKSSGQLGTRIFGNRSYNQKAASEEDARIVKTEKSGYYITVNFYRRTITLLRFGWIDHSDWIAQTSSTGQAATLKDDVYRYKLVAIPGAYRLKAPISLLPKVGPKTALTFAIGGVTTLAELLGYAGADPALLKLQKEAKTMEGLQD